MKIAIKLSAAFLITVLLLSFAGCSGHANTNKPDSSSAGTGDAPNVLSSASSQVTPTSNSMQTMGNAVTTTTSGSAATASNGSQQRIGTTNSATGSASKTGGTNPSVKSSGGQSAKASGGSSAQAGPTASKTSSSSKTATSSSKSISTSVSSKSSVFSKPASSSSKSKSAARSSSTKPASSSQPKTAYDKPYDINQIRADMIAYGRSKGMTLDTTMWVKNEPPMYPSNCSYFPPTNTFEDICTADELRSDCKASIDYIVKVFEHDDPVHGAIGTRFNVVCLPLANHPGDYFIFVLYG